MDGVKSPGFAGKELKMFKPVKELTVEVDTNGKKQTAKVQVDGRHSFGSNEAKRRDSKRPSE